MLAQISATLGELVLWPMRHHTHDPERGRTEEGRLGIFGLKTPERLFGMRAVWKSYATCTVKKSLRVRTQGKR
jgi:hypothetical protein